MSEGFLLADVGVLIEPKRWEGGNDECLGCAELGISRK